MSARCQKPVTTWRGESESLSTLGVFRFMDGPLQVSGCGWCLHP